MWEIHSEATIGEAVLAIAAAQDHLESFDVVPMDLHHLEREGIACERAESSTPVEDLKKSHLNLVQLTYQKLGIIAYHIVDKFRQEKVKRYTRADLKRILRTAIAQGRLEAKDLKDSVRNKL